MANALRSRARQLMDDMAPGERTLRALVDGLRLLSQGLTAGLAPALGIGGVRLLMSLAIGRAATRHPVLAGVSVYEDGIDATEVLLERSDRDYEAVRESFVDLWYAFLELLAEMIGPGLTLRLVGEAMDQGPGHETRGTRPTPLSPNPWSEEDEP